MKTKNESYEAYFKAIEEGNIEEVKTFLLTSELDPSANRNALVQLAQLWFQDEIAELLKKDPRVIAEHNRNNTPSDKWNSPAISWESAAKSLLGER